MVLGTGWYEIERSFDRGSADANYWTGVRRYVGPKGAEELISVNHLGTTTWNTPEGVALIPRRVRIIANAREGGSVSNVDCSEIEVLYRSAYNPVTHPVGYATLAVSAQPMLRKALIDKDKLIVEGLDPSNDGFFYKVEKGENIKIVSRSVVVIRTAVAQSGINWNTILAKVNKINSDPLPTLGCVAETMLLVAASIPKYFLYNAYSDGNSNITHVPINYVFWYETKGWNSIVDDGIITDEGTCKSKYYWRGPKAIRVVDQATNIATTLVGDFKYIHKNTLAENANAADAKLIIRTSDRIAKFVTTPDQNEGYRRLYASTTFADLDALLWWTT